MVGMGCGRCGVSGLVGGVVGWVGGELGWVGGEGGVDVVLGPS